VQIRKEQMQAFSKASLGRLEERVADFLQREFPDARALLRAELLPVIHEQVKQARSYCLETEHQISIYVTTAWLLGQDFNVEFPTAHEKLSSTENTPDEKSEWLSSWTEEMFTHLDGDRQS